MPISAQANYTFIPTYLQRKMGGNESRPSQLEQLAVLPFQIAPHCRQFTAR